MEVFRSIVAAYIVVTLCATSLAKLKNWRLSSVNVMRESIIPSRAAVVTVITVSCAELIFAILFMLGINLRAVGLAGAGLFLGFCVYQLLVAARTNSLICSCAGTTRTDPASWPAVTGTIFSCLAQAALSFTLAVTNGHPTAIFYLLTVSALVVPVTVFLLGLLRRTEPSELTGRFWLAG